MKFHSLQGVMILSLSAGVFVLGCGQSNQESKTDKKATPVAEKKGDHEGWWCPEHGLPEAECSQCDARSAADFKAKGDWCAEHERAKSQCFKCDPKLKDKYAAIYRAKEGKEPPETEDDSTSKK
jgi:hypothetical protein